MGRERGPFGCPRSYKYKATVCKRIELIPPSNNELIHLYTRRLKTLKTRRHLSLKIGRPKQAIVTKRDVTQQVRNVG